MQSPLEPTPLGPALAVLSSMITPAVLISACGTLILTTSTRLGRVVDRVRHLSDRLEVLAAPALDGADVDVMSARQALVFELLDRATNRARLLQRGLTVFYAALALFVATSVAIGVVALVHARFAWVPVTLGMIGAALLLVGSSFLIAESRLALAAIFAEMDFAWWLGQRHVPAELRREGRPRRGLARRGAPPTR